MNDNKLDLEAIRKRAEAATEGLWTNFEDVAYLERRQVYEYDELTETNVDVIADCRRIQDAEFIANARQDVPALIAEVERLREIKKEADLLMQALYREGREEMDFNGLANALGKEALK